MTVGDFKSNFSEVKAFLAKGIQVAVTNGKQNKVIGYMVPPTEIQPTKKLAIA